MTSSYASGSLKHYNLKSGVIFMLKLSLEKSSSPMFLDPRDESHSDPRKLVHETSQQTSSENALKPTDPLIGRGSLLGVKVVITTI